MKLLIHDLGPDKWDAVRGEYADWTVISDNGAMHPCVGCFGCWSRDPGRCAIKDGYENMGYLIHHSDEVRVISRYTYGGFSGSVKNVFDRCLAYVLPQFEVIDGETHHKKRYDEDKAFTFIFYGHDLSESEKDSARRYVRAVCANIRGRVRDAIFLEEEDLPASDEHAGADNELPDSLPAGASGKTVILNGSMRNVSGNSAKLAKALEKRLNKDTEIIDLKTYLHDISELICRLEHAPEIILCMPLYVDGLPSQVIRLMEKFEGEYRGGKKRIYVLTNMGLYESSQLINLFDAVRQWCGRMGFEYCGGLGVSAGELLGTLMESIPLSIGPTKMVARGMKRLAEAIDRDKRIEDIYTEPYGFPRSLYIWIANTNWNRLAKQNGIEPKDLYRRV